MGQPTNHENKLDEVGWDDPITGTDVNLQIPAQLGMLPLLGATTREYCAALPKVFAALEARNRHIASYPEQAEALRKRFGTGQLKLPGTGAVTIIAGFSHFVYSAELVLQEAATNIIRHGYNGEKLQENVWLNLGAAVVLDRATSQRRRTFVMELSDTAAAFDPTNALWREPDPLEPRESGYGIFLIRRLTNGIGYRRQAGRNCLRMIKYVEMLTS